MTRTFVALGSNLGDREDHLRRALEALGELGRVTAISGLHETEPIGYRDQPDFLNAVVELETELSPEELLGRLQEIERRLGRRPTFRDGPRTIDLDLLLHGDAVIDRPELRLPHPRMTERRFVLEPLAEIAPEIVHPVSGLRVSEMLRGLEEREKD
jgi:2-amino-4-hydroxy-6-hydroxymethyldihydropteridine diphosphokinase